MGNLTYGKKKRICYVVVVVGSWNFHDILHHKLEILKGGGKSEGVRLQKLYHTFLHILYN